MSKRKYIDEETVSAEDDRNTKNSHLSYSQTFFGPYLSERQWCTVREESLGNCWDEISYDTINPGSYHWGEDGIFGLSDDEQKLCIGFTLWNGKDDIVKERLFGLTGPQGNHGEDVKELYFYLDNLPYHRYMRGFYLYPQSEFPYQKLIEENKTRGARDPEYEILDTDVFTKGYWLIDVEYGKPDNGTILCRYTVTNKGPKPCTLELSPKFWFRNCEKDGVRNINLEDGNIKIRYDLGDFIVRCNKSKGNTDPVYKFPTSSDKGHTSCTATYRIHVDPGKQDYIEWQMTPCSIDVSYSIEKNLQELKQQADTFYESLYCDSWSSEERLIARGAWAGLLWNKQFYYYDVDEWYKRGQADESFLEDTTGNWNVHARNRKWKQHFKAHDILAVPDKWEFPWFAAWDTCFQMIPYCRLDPEFAKNQLLLLLSDRYMSPEGQIPGCEFNFDDNNPPLHAWACLKVFRMTGESDTYFLSRAYQKLQRNYNWWMSNLQITDSWTFSGGFLGLDNISVIDRGSPPNGYILKQADASAWMSLFALSMVQMADVLASHSMLDTASQDMIRYLTDFLHIADQLNKDVHDGGLWNPNMNFYNDVLIEKSTEKFIPIEIKSLVGLLPLVACCYLKLSQKITADVKTILETDSSYIVKEPDSDSYFLTCVPRHRIQCLIHSVFDEDEFLAKFGIRSLSKVYTDPYILTLPVLTRIPVRDDKTDENICDEGTDLKTEGSPKSPLCLDKATKEETVSRSLCLGEATNNEATLPGTLCAGKATIEATAEGENDSRKMVLSPSKSASKDISKGDNSIEVLELKEFSISYAPAESDSEILGGNSNWRGPVWICANYLLLDALEQICNGFHEEITVTRNDGGKRMNVRLDLAIRDVCGRLVSIFRPDTTGGRPLHGTYTQYKEGFWKDLMLYYEYFNPDTGKGCGASHQTGWTSLIAEILYKLYR